MLGRRLTNQRTLTLSTRLLNAPLPPIKPPRVAMVRSSLSVFQCFIFPPYTRSLYCSSSCPFLFPQFYPLQDSFLFPLLQACRSYSHAPMNGFAHTYVSRRREEGGRQRVSFSLTFYCLHLFSPFCVSTSTLLFSTPLSIHVRSMNFHLGQCLSRFREGTPPTSPRSNALDRWPLSSLPRFINDRSG